MLKSRARVTCAAAVQNVGAWVTVGVRSSVGKQLNDTEEGHNISLARVQQAQKQHTGRARPQW